VYVSLRIIIDLFITTASVALRGLGEIGFAGLRIGSRFLEELGEKKWDKP
jgi:hypothetical protein